MRPVLAFPKLNKLFLVEVDASDYAAGGVLSQTGEDNILHPISYLSLLLPAHDENGHQLRRRLLR